MHFWNWINIEKWIAELCLLNFEMSIIILCPDRMFHRIFFQMQSTWYTIKFDNAVNEKHLSEFQLQSNNKT